MIRQGQAMSLVRGNMRRKHQTLIGMAVLTLAMTSGSAVAQEAAFGASLQPRIVEGESQKPPGTFYIVARNQLPVGSTPYNQINIYDKSNARSARDSFSAGPEVNPEGLPCPS
jgi:hypothetical protein